MYDVIIVGAGLSGIATLYNLSKLVSERARVLIIDSRADIGGIAYNTASSAQILNVPASKMSIDCDLADDFVTFLRSTHPEFSPESFVPRSVYREYLDHHCDKISGQSNIELTFIGGDVSNIKIEENLFSVSLGEDHSHHGRFVVLALGNSLKDRGFNETLLNPWSNEDLESALNSPTIAVLGSSLTAIDVILDMESRGYKGRYNIYSRRGLFPLDHRAVINSNFEEHVSSITSAPTLLKKLRSFRRSVDSGVEWRGLIDALREPTAKIWGSLSIIEQKAFFRHLRPFWDIHRHRVPAESFDAIQRLKNNGRLIIKRGRVLSATKEEGTFELSTRYRSQISDEKVGAIFNCLGLWSDITRTTSQLVNSMLDTGLALPDQLRMGLQCTNSGELVSKTEMLEDGSIYTLGSLRRGEFLESTAARELRKQAKEIAVSISARINR